ncbi:TetR/AcrR family transcriptional regulator [Bacillus toyonensis]|uniref:TetR/AcrR family transcriptional regulator n=1 Tax=Bacillus toyonensis TaxID=155322 RepID=UPI00114604D4|nr:TetR/AcrR family transcriptional regulator [Bacillus toyonensis]MDF9451352.1 TetR/AcrR family transcriptional regulator [Bacillus toyonensis]MDG1564269.1 TetR/AcrR family transcriptional regulator [Bacillus toyonensis]
MINLQGKRGRPRNIETQKAILSASYELLLESGFKAVTVDKIADRAKVSKATIYKWWPNKAAVVMDGFLSAAAERLPVPDTGSALTDILTHATSLASFLISREGTIITELVGEGQFDSKLAEEYRARYFQPRRLQAKQLLEKGIKRGELKENLDVDLSIDLIYGPIFYRLLVTGEKLDESYVHDLVINAFEGIQLN